MNRRTGELVQAAREAGAWDSANNSVRRLGDELRSARLRALEVLWNGSSVRRVWDCCRTPAGQTVTLTAGVGVKGSVNGLATCGSVWCCPMCASKVWAKRSEELAAALERWHAKGGRVLMVTLTMRHNKRQALWELWDAVGAAWGACSGDYSAPRAALKRAGCEGWVRRVEHTIGPNGWHVHVHALLFLAPADEVALAEPTRLVEAMWSAWERRLATLPGKGWHPPLVHSKRYRPGMERTYTAVRDSGGLHWRLLDLESSAGEAGKYLAKGYYPAKAAGELTAADHKEAANGNLAPFGLLAAVVAGETERWGRELSHLWYEWERTSHGRRAMTWGKGTRETLGLGDEADDEEVAATEDEPAPVSWAYQIDASDWRTIAGRTGTPGTGAGLIGGLLDAIEIEESQAREERLDELLDPLGILYLPAERAPWRPNWAVYVASGVP